MCEVADDLPNLLLWRQVTSESPRFDPKQHVEKLFLLKNEQKSDRMDQKRSKSERNDKMAKIV